MSPISDEIALHSLAASARDDFGEEPVHDGGYIDEEPASVYAGFGGSTKGRKTSFISLNRPPGSGESTLIRDAPAEGMVSPTNGGELLPGTVPATVAESML